MQTNDIFNHLLSSDRAGREVNDDQLNNIHPHCLHTAHLLLADGNRIIDQIWGHLG